MRRTWLLHFVLLGILAGSGQAYADTYTVNSTLDLPDGDPTDNACATAPPAPVCTLRAAVMQANAHAGADVIEVPAGTYLLTRVGYDQTASLGDLDITDDVTIIGNGPVVIDANGSVTFDRAFEVVSGSLELHGVTIKNGNTPSYGGAIYAQGVLDLYDVSVLNNTAALDGGGVYATDSVGIYTSILQGNTTQGSGGGIGVQSNGFRADFFMISAEVAGNQALGYGGGVNLSGASGGASGEVANTSLHDNSAGYSGGGLAYFGLSSTTLEISNSVFDHNMATGAGNGDGGGLYSYSEDNIANNTILDSKFTNNSAYFGGGIFANSGTHLTDVTVSHNNAIDGGGVYVFYGIVDVLRGRVDSNTATASGGGFAAEGVGDLHLAITDSSVFANSAADGGGVWTTGIGFTAMSSVIYNNHAGRGGGVFAGAATTKLNDSTIDGNSARSYGGGVFAEFVATVELNSATVTGNRARTSYPSPGAGAGIYVTAQASVTATASVFAYNNNSGLTPAPSDCFGTLILSDYNFVSTNGGCTITLLSGAVHNLVGDGYPFIINPSLSALVRLYDPAPASPPHASPKFGRVPLTGSPLIDAGPPGGCKAADGSDLLWDQIGQVRALNGLCDIGAIEYGAALDEVFGNGFDI